MNVTIKILLIIISTALFSCLATSFVFWIEKILLSLFFSTHGVQFTPYLAITAFKSSIGPSLVCLLLLVLFLEKNILWVKFSNRVKALNAMLYGFIVYILSIAIYSMEFSRFLSSEYFQQIFFSFLWGLPLSFLPLLTCGFSALFGLGYAYNKIMVKKVKSSPHHEERLWSAAHPKHGLPEEGCFYVIENYDSVEEQGNGRFKYIGDYNGDKHEVVVSVTTSADSKVGRVVTAYTTDSEYYLEDWVPPEED